MAICLIRRMMLSPFAMESADDIPAGPLCPPQYVRGKYASDWRLIMVHYNVANTVEGLFDAYNKTLADINL